ncbi:MAG: alpha/beta fold hydrolase [Sediminispirochaetaceae bacterium]
MSVYKSEKGKNAVREAVQEIYRQCPVPAESLWLDTEDFGPTHVLTAGDPAAPPLVLLHGSASNSASWFGYLSSWSKVFRIYAVDIPGQPGLSGEERPGVSDGASVRWLEELVEKLGLEYFHICGQSLGGCVGLQYAACRTDHLRSLALISPSGLHPPRVSFLFKILPFLFLGDRGARKINRIVSGKVAVDSRYEEFSLLTARHFIPLMEKLPVLTDEELERIRCPLLYIAGAEDVLLNTARSAKRLRDILPDSEINILENVGHVVLDQGDVLEDFFKKKRVEVRLDLSP